MLMRRCGFNEETKIGDLLLNGTIYTGRDAAHKRIVNFLDEGKALPVKKTISSNYEAIGPPH